MFSTKRMIVLTSSALVTAATAMSGAVIAGDCGGYASKSACSSSCSGSKMTLAAKDSCGGEATTAANVQLASMKKKDGADIVDTAVSAGSFNTLVAAVKAAGLVDTLKSDGPFTVFAPTDAAFAKLPAGTIDTLLKPENKATLQAILTYHVVPGKLTASAVKRSGGAITANGQKIDFTSKKDSVMVDGATVVKADIMTSNGVIHVIDNVILPASDNIVQTAGSAGVFNTLLTAAKEAGLADALADGGPFTVFAPTDEAFAKLPAGTVESLLKPANRDKLAAILKYHVVSGRAYAADAVKAGSVSTLQGGKVLFSVRNGALFVDNAKIVKTDLDASNGVIHVIDSVILPN